MTGARYNLARNPLLIVQMTIEAVKEAFCERECEHFGVSPFTILDAIGAKVVEEYARMVERLQKDPRLDLSKAQLDAVPHSYSYIYIFIHCF